MSKCERLKRVWGPAVGDQNRFEALRLHWKKGGIPLQDPTPLLSFWCTHLTNHCSFSPKVHIPQDSAS